MTEESDDATLSVQIANQFINVANSLMSDGKSPLAIAAGLRHAGANFTAFAIIHGEQEFPPQELLNNEFNELFSYYRDRHNKKPSTPTRLMDLVEKVKSES